jgi:formate/nitrite transporter FocA (FNT family)
MGTIGCVSAFKRYAEISDLAGPSTLTYGVAHKLAGLAFYLGLILVVVGGTELFTRHSLIMITRASICKIPLL